MQVRQNLGLRTEEDLSRQDELYHSKLRYLYTSNHNTLEVRLQESVAWLDMLPDDHLPLCVGTLSGLPEIRNLRETATREYLELCKLSGPTVQLWSSADHLELCKLSGPTVQLWSSANHLELCKLSGPTVQLWSSANHLSYHPRIDLRAQRAGDQYQKTDWKNLSGIALSIAARTESHFTARHQARLRTTTIGTARSTTACQTHQWILRRLFRYVERYLHYYEGCSAPEILPGLLPDLGRSQRVIAATSLTRKCRPPARPTKQRAVP